jgi:hypothetical protein
MRLVPNDVLWAWPVYRPSGVAFGPRAVNDVRRDGPDGTPCVDGPAALDAKVGLSHNQPRSRPMELKRIAMDTSKYVFTLHGVDAEDRVVLRRELRRSQVEGFFAALAPTEVVLEACGASHHWGRVLQRLGHRVRLIPAQYVKPFVKRGKSDRIDAEAIAEAASRPEPKATPGGRYT